ncbi:hypothetical protein TYRP_008757 [Tyrophagus putrescentiae]|nr:hypothetical protein TYRP_008757 [Tyrophagus putrescentiae]
MRNDEKSPQKSVVVLGLTLTLPLEATEVFLGSIGAKGAPPARVHRRAQRAVEGGRKGGKVGQRHIHPMAVAGVDASLATAVRRRLHHRQHLLLFGAQADAELLSVGGEEVPAGAMHRLQSF